MGEYGRHGYNEGLGAGLQSLEVDLPKGTAALPASAPPAQGGRLHHLDWLRAVMITLAVYLQIWQMLGGDLAASAAPPAGGGGDGLSAQHGLDVRWIASGRQLVVPMLFFVNGASLALSNTRLLAAFEKVGAITVIGVWSNALLWLLGPRREDCSLRVADTDEGCKGTLVNYVVAPGVGKTFAIIHQFWFTLLVLLFMVEDGPLFVVLRQLHAEGSPRGGAALVGRRLVGLGLRWALLACLFLGLARDTPWDAAWVAALELPFDGLLLLSACAPPGRALEVRLCQYLAALVAIAQFGYPDFQVEPFGARQVLYFHIFKQFAALGYVATLTRQKSGPALSQVWPATLVLLVLCCSLAGSSGRGMPAYPWLPLLRDRLIYCCGSFVLVFATDRVGRCFALLDLCAPVPKMVGFGALLLYMFHPVLFVVFSSFGLRDADPAVVTIAIASVLTGVASVLRSPPPRRRRKQLPSGPTPGGAQLPTADL